MLIPCSSFNFTYCFFFMFRSSIWDIGWNMNLVDGTVDSRSWLTLRRSLLFTQQNKAPDVFFFHRILWLRSTIHFLCYKSSSKNFNWINISEKPFCLQKSLRTTLNSGFWASFQLTTSFVMIVSLSSRSYRYTNMCTYLYVPTWVLSLFSLQKWDYIIHISPYFTYFTQ